MTNDDEIMKIIGRRIQKIRRERGYTQEKFAEMIDLSTNYLSDIERGKSSMRLDKLVTIINALGCSADEVFEDVTKNGFEIKSTKLSEKIKDLPHSEQQRAFAILDAFIEN